MILDFENEIIINPRLDKLVELLLNRTMKFTPEIIAKLSERELLPIKGMLDKQIEVGDIEDYEKFSISFNDSRKTKKNFIAAFIYEIAEISEDEAEFNANLEEITKCVKPKEKLLDLSDIMNRV